MLIPRSGCYPDKVLILTKLFFDHLGFDKVLISKVFYLHRGSLESVSPPSRYLDYT